MSNLDYISLLPDSIFDNSAGSNTYKLWALTALQMDEIDSVFDDIRMMSDYSSSEGETLEIIGKIVREKRLGRTDAEYIKFLYIALKKYRSSGSIPDLSEICKLVLGAGFLCVRDLTHDTGVARDLTWLNGEWFLDGSLYLSGDIYQPALFEVAIQDAVSDSMVRILSAVVLSCRSAGIKARIIKLSEV